MDEPRTSKEKRLQTLAIETEKQKKALLTQLRKTPIVHAACERSGIGRSTYYKWRANDKPFARAADKCIEFGCFLINDLAESRLIRLIQDDNLTAIIFWLKHNNPKYAVLNRVIHEYETVTHRPTVEEQHLHAQEMGRLYAQRLTPELTPEEIAEKLDAENEEAERDEPDRKRMEELLRDENEQPTDGL